MNLKGIFATKGAIIGVIAVVVFVGGGWTGVEYYTSQSSFCGGSCHIMGEQDKAWKVSKHHASNSADGSQAECIQCHFLPGEKSSIDGKLIGLRHLAAYLLDPKAPLPIRAKIKDGACLSSGCHEKAAFQDKEIKFAEKVTFKHKAHFEKGLDGQGVSCETCHFKQSAEKHFEVPKEICFLCHLKPENPTDVTTPAGLTTASHFTFNQGRAKCDSCHTMPAVSLQKQKNADDPDAKAITHETLQDAKVPCESCHLHLVEGTGAINTGKVNADGCLSCHNATVDLNIKAQDKALMHGKHIADKRADCFDCHDSIQHGKGSDGKVANYLETIGSNCTACHPDKHRFQKILLSGANVIDGVSGTPGLMDRVSTNCLGCHVKTKHAKGQMVMTGDERACVACHAEKHAKMLQDWKDFLAREVASAKEIEAEALQALEKAAGVAPADVIKKAEKMIVKGREAIAIVEFGNGVHNKKYAVMLLDEAFGNFEDAIDVLDSGG